RQALRAALAIEPENHRARFYLALGDAQEGKLKVALAQWQVLRAELEGNSRFLPSVVAQIEKVEQLLARRKAQPGGKDPAGASSTNADGVE
ncbi:MAG: hypothetical protein KUG61_00235, partial [Parvibaculaceae bacterium]|nr:hypothetical protein [Parvibaculaceae bacterium]